MSNEIITVIEQRISLRRYAPQSIRVDHLEAIICSTMRAPNAGNMMSNDMFGTGGQAQ
jgi:nitroreductase